MVKGTAHLIQINPVKDIFVETRSDVRLPMKKDENACCRAIKNVLAMQFPTYGIRWMNANYCPICGRKIER
jgi:uncharacterized Fe-S cluster-containing MiaB family protein